MNKKGNPIKKLLVLAVVVAVLFGIYSLFFSEKIRNMGYYVDESVKLISYNDLRRNNIPSNKIDDLVLSFNGKMSCSEINSISNQFSLNNVLSDFINSNSEKDKKHNVLIFDDMFINFYDNVTTEQIREIEKKYKIKLKLNSEYSNKDKLYTFSLPRDVKSSQDIKDLLKKLTNEKIIEYSQPSYLCAATQFSKESGHSSAKGTSTNATGVNRERPWIPNDPKYNKQWNLKDIETELAWNHTKGKGVIVAVIDTGVSSRGEDLDPRRFVDGYNFVSNNKNATDDHGHGTHVAGTIAQTTNNRKGVAGVAPEAKIMPLKVLSKYGYGDIADIAEAVRWAADNGAHIINMSLGGGGRTQIMEDAIKYAQERGVVVVAAAGNEDNNRASYPAYYENVVSVASYGPDGKRAHYSNYGDGVRIAAPGGSDQTGRGIEGKILQETISGYEWYQGTSMASPHVAGVAALIRSAGVKDANKIIDVLYNSSRKVDNDSKNEFGAGKLNAKNAIQMAIKMSSSPDSIVENIGISRQNLFIYIAGAIIFLIIFLMWYNKKKAIGAVYDMSFILFLLGIVISTIGLIFPTMFAQNFFTKLISSPLPQFDSVIFGARNPIFHSALIPIIFAMLLSGSKGSRSFTVAVSLGFASVLVVDAFILFSDITFIPNLFNTTLIDRVFLVLNALISMLLSMAVIKR